jgi:hypothetical protein
MQHADGWEGTADFLAQGGAVDAYIEKTREPRKRRHAEGVVVVRMVSTARTTTEGHTEGNAQKGGTDGKGQAAFGDERQQKEYAGIPQLAPHVAHGERHVEPPRLDEILALHSVR